MWAMIEKLRMNSRSMRYDECSWGGGPPPSLSHMSYSHIVFDTGEDGIAQVTINRPDKLNALNTATVLELEDAFRRVRTESGIRALIITGAGEKAFVAGADINELAVLSPVEAQS